MIHRLEKFHGPENALFLHSPVVTDTFQCMQAVCQSSNSRTGILESLPHLQAAVQPGDLDLVARSIGRDFSLRDLAKWCQRISHLHSSSWRSDGFLTEEQRVFIFLEALDCFSGMIPSGHAKECIALLLARIWTLSEEHAIHSLQLRKPTVTVCAP